MRRLLRIAAIAVLALAGAGFSAGQALGQPLCRDFGYGNVGFDAGYSMAVGRCFTRGWSVGGGWGHGCGFRPIVSSCWRPCGWAGGWWGGYGWPRRCLPRPFCGTPGFWFGSPCFGFGGWAGAASYLGSQSVYLATPFGGGATFFSGSVVPYPVPYAVPYAVPYPMPGFWFGAARRPLAAAPVVAAAQPATVRQGVLNPPVVRAAAVGPRPSAAQGRRRAKELVATGDRLLREAAADPVRLRTAADAYRRAAAAAADDPDIHVRHAIALVALGRDREADLAVQRATKIDGRLVDRPGERAAGQPAPVIARGVALLRSIAGGHGGPLPQPLADLTAAWSGEAAGPRVRLAANDDR